MDPARVQRALRQTLMTEQLLGIDAVPVRSSGVSLGVDADVLTTADAMNTTHQRAGSSSSPVSGATGGTHASRAIGARPADTEAEDGPARGSESPASPAPVDTAYSDDQPAPHFSVGHEVRSVDSLFAPSDRPRLSRDEKLRVLTDLDQNHVKPCTKCDLCKGRIQTVFGDGDADAKLMFVGEGPGQNEDEQGRPFVGRAGELLDKMIVAMGLKREQVFIANVVKCRPPDNRPPTPTESDACWPYLRTQIETIQPRVIVTLGASATKFLLRTDRNITSIRGVWHTLKHAGPGGQDIAVMPTFHPAYLLRNYTPDTRGKVWSDLKKVMAHLTGDSGEKP